VNIVFTILNWGLGHAVRCITIIDYLKNNGHNIHIASDGIALDFLKETYPDLVFHELPSYGIKYKYTFMPLNIIEKGPRLIKTLFNEHRATKQIVKANQIDLIINDNRLACFHNEKPSVFISHQLTIPVRNRAFRKFTNFLHHLFINKYDYCWIPDFKDTNNLAGDISYSTRKSPPKQYLGPLTTLKLIPNREDLPLLIVLSGPEPQRSIFERKIINQASQLEESIVLVRGTNKSRSFDSTNKHLEILDLVDRNKLALLIQRAKRVICRSGYTSIMDFALNPKALYFVPTPGQYEQEYLAKHWFEKMRVPFCAQQNFNLKEAFENATLPKMNYPPTNYAKEIDKLLAKIH
jgi:uncharacterized protein (TIGR00661 family)